MKKYLLIFILPLFWLSALSEDRIPSGCTVITISKGNNVFFGGNNDFINPDSWYFVEQGDSSKYGVVWIGTPDNPQQGINEKGWHMMQTDFRGLR